MDKNQEEEWARAIKMTFLKLSRQNPGRPFPIPYFGFTEFIFHDGAPEPSYAKLWEILLDLESQGLFKIIEEDEDELQVWVMPTFDRLVRRESHAIPEGPIAQGDMLPEMFGINVVDREVRVNQYILSRPYATGMNLAFIEYAIENSDRVIQMSELPDHLSSLLDGTPLKKVLNALGFKGEILKTFFPQRGKNSFIFRKEVSTKDLLDRGLKPKVLLIELQLADAKNRPG